MRMMMMMMMRVRMMMMKIRPEPPEQRGASDQDELYLPEEVLTKPRSTPVRSPTCSTPRPVNVKPRQMIVESRRNHQLVTFCLLLNNSRTDARVPAFRQRPLVEVLKSLVGPRWDWLVELSLTVTFFSPRTKLGCERSGVELVR